MRRPAAGGKRLVLVPAPAGGTVIVDVAASNYDAAVFVDPGGAGRNAGCSSDRYYFWAHPGTTYTILVVDSDGIGNGGTLAISNAGTATLSGTFTCTGSHQVWFWGKIIQRSGQGSVIGTFVYFSDHGTSCDGLPHPWTTASTPENGQFGAGDAATVTFSHACDFWGENCVYNPFDMSALLLRGGK